MLPGRRDLAVAHDVDVLAGALADVAVLVEQDRLLVAGLDRLDLREHAVQVLARGLRVGDQRARADPLPRGDLRADAVALALLAEVGAPLPAGDRHVDRRVERVEAHLAVAAVDDRADVARAHAVASDELERRRAQLLGRVGHGHVVELGRLAAAARRGRRCGTPPGRARCRSSARPRTRPCRSAARASGRGPWRPPRRRNLRSSI